MTPGDVEIGNNFAVLHARSAFEDGSGRDLLRLWLGVADGWPLPESFRRTREFGPLLALRRTARQGL